MTRFFLGHGPYPGSAGPMVSRSSGAPLVALVLSHFFSSVRQLGTRNFQVPCYERDETEGNFAIPGQLAAKHDRIPRPGQREIRKGMTAAPRT